MDRIIPPLNDTQKVMVMAAARALLTVANGGPVPFRHQGRTIRGIDCIGVLAAAFGVLGYPIEDRTDYGRLPADRKLSASLQLHFGEPVLRAPVAAGALQPCDVVTMAWGAENSHVGLVVPHPHGVGLVHAYLSAQRVIEHRIDDLWRSRITEVYRP